MSTIAMIVDARASWLQLVLGVICMMVIANLQ